MKKLIILSLIISIGITSYGQNYRYRHAKGLTGADLNFGLSKNGTVVELGIVDFLSTSRQQLCYLNYEWGKVGTTDFNIISASYLRQFSVYNLRQNFYLNVFCGSSVGYEFVTNDFLDQKKNSVVPGAIVGFELEACIYNQLSGIIKGQEQYKFNSNIGEWSYRFQIGARYFF